MRVTRGIARPLLFLALLILISSADVAEAGLFDSLIQNMFAKVQGLVQNVVEETRNKFSVLSGFFGDGRTRSELTLPEIYNIVFSRNNSIFIANSTTTNMDWTLGDGSTVIGAISSGGAISISNNGGTVSLTTSTQTQGKEEKEKDSQNGESKGSGKGDEKSDEAVESPQAEDRDTVTVQGSDLDKAFIELLSDWNSFVTSSIWGAQDNEGEEPQPSSEESSGDTSLETSERVINGVFLGNRIASGSGFAVKFFYNNEENFYCSGSLIGYPYALTAAHCGIVLGDEVRVGGRLLRSGYKAKVAEVFNHPHFNPSSLVHDIAIVKLEGLSSKEDMKKNGVKAARLNKNDEFPENGFIGVLSAHGSVQTDGKGVSDELLSTRHTVKDLKECQEEITQGDLKDEASYLCAGDGERSTTCVGDSGAGLWRYRVTTTAGGKTRRFYEIFGVVSFGEVTDEALCPRGPPTVFQRTSTNYDWIVDVVGKENMP